MQSRVARTMEQVIEKARAPVSDEQAGRLVALAERRRNAIRRAFTRLHPVALGCGAGVTGGLALLLATLVLGWRGGPEAAAALNAVSRYLPGLDASLPGALLGAPYGFAAGFFAGFATAAFRNLALQIVLAYARWSAERFRRRHMLDEI